VPRFEAKAAEVELAFTQSIAHRYGWGRQWITTPWLVGAGKQPLEAWVLVADASSTPKRPRPLDARPLVNHTLRKSSVNGCSGRARASATTIFPGVYPTRANRASLRPSAS
jgi:hypothetical protein